ncbi:hypothetical protein HRM2_14660 [Desulforapulum autotrophicum HRM2]|uniref:Uncharacterized protein n=1 Tax=Desulforapulum autotrophicum (strain ATCC 43914 / DSM 3382 / VKM B-1955 / HRM2) TaxID=177437 RepID=C0Q9L1_DESAH|nr:hypothetical protein [Desulforapulum autotrophicum]ACN14575.1 hypothetical protein HRM2_14660 [Desulforapulum autotrophicum HRM2]
MNKGFQDFEDKLLINIKNSESPFLGLFENQISSKMRQNIISFIQKQYDPFDKFIDLLDDYPAVFSTLLVVQLLEDFGKHGHFEVYPFFEKIFDQTLTQHQKEVLWQAFRIACMYHLGISVSPRRSGPHYMVREYLRQVGLPLRYVDQFTVKALRYVDKTGIPDLDDPELLKLWQEGLVDRLTPLTVKEAIQRDDICYHSQLFISCLQGGKNSLRGKSRLEAAILKAIEAGPKIRKAKQAGIPRVILRESEYGILLPGSKEPVQWEIITGDETRKFTSRNDDRFLSFEMSLPPDAVVINDEGFRCSYSLWENQKNNRLLIFSMPDGRFVTGSSLAEKEVFLDPGNYLFLTRFSPENEEEYELFSDNPEVYSQRVSLAPGETYVFQRGPAKLQIKAEEKPALYFTQEPLRGVRGNELYPADNLKLDIIIPKEMLMSDEKFVVRVTSNTLGEEIVLPFPAQENNQFVLNIGKLMEQYWVPGVSRVLFAVYREDIKRALVRKSAVIWSGLPQMKNRARFACTQLPANLVQDDCENLQVDLDTNSITFSDETNRFFKMAFKDGVRTLYFTWAVPGVFLSLKDYGRADHAEKGLKLGETISINTSSRKVLTVFASEPCLLKIGQYETQVDFSRVGSKRIPLSGMVDYLEPGHDTLLLYSEKYPSALPLLRFVSPFEAKSYSTESGIELRKIELSIRSPIQSLRFSIKNLIDNISYEINVDLKQIGQTYRHEILPDIYATFFKVDENECTIHYPETGWPSGLWLTSFIIKAENRWGALADSNGAVFADGLLSTPSQIGQSFEDLWWWFSNNHDPDTYAQIFSRLDEALRIKYALGCWKNLSWLESFWIKLGKKISYDARTEDCLKLLSLVGDRNSITEEGDAIPKLHPGTAVPAIFCQGKNVYPEKRLTVSSFHSCLRFMPKFNNPCHAFSHRYLDVAALFGFQNAMAVVQTECAPQKFTTSAYMESLSARDLPEKWRYLNDDQWIPAKGDILGPMHYRYAVDRFQGEFSNAMAMGSERLGHALALSKQMKNVSISNLAGGGAISRLDTDSDPVMLFNRFHPQPEWLDDEAAVAIENQKNIIRFISLFAQVCRWESREAGIMDNFKEKAIKTCSLPANAINKYLGYLLYLSEDLFCFYLLLWELVFSVDCDQPRRRYV